jgi:glycosyltransferase involved in cell wall biosynthesis
MEIDIPVINNAVGDCLGFSNSQKNIVSALKKRNVKISKLANKELWNVSPHLYDRSYTRESILWWPYEANNIPKHLIEKAQYADYIIASNEHNKKTFIDAGIKKDIHVCNLAIDTDFYRYKEREIKNDFVFLWVGQNSQRKGMDIVIKAFMETFKKNDPVQLYIKTTDKEKHELYIIHDKVFVDSRLLSEVDLLDLYYKSNCFVFPSRGEATGLPAMEAMSTGCLVLAPPIMGLKDFVNKETAIPLDYKYMDGFYGVDIKAPNVDYKYLSEIMRDAYENYNSYSDIMKQGSDLIKKSFSLPVLGNNLVKIIWRNHE